jgi:CBS domain-containing protein
MTGETRSTLTAADVMTTSPRTCSAYSSVLEATLIFRDADCGAVPIVDGGQPIGILTDRDVALALPNFSDLASRAVADIMTKGVITVAPGASLEEIEARFVEHRVHRLLVVDAAGQLLGIVSRTDLVGHLPRGSFEHLGRQVVEQPSETS